MTKKNVRIAGLLTIIIGMFLPWMTISFIGSESFNVLQLADQIAAFGTARWFVYVLYGIMALSVIAIISSVKEKGEGLANTVFVLTTVVILYAGFKGYVTYERGLGSVFHGGIGYYVTLVGSIVGGIMHVMKADYTPRKYDRSKEFR